MEASGAQDNWPGGASPDYAVACKEVSSEQEGRKHAQATHTDGGFSLQGATDTKLVSVGHAAGFFYAGAVDFDVTSCSRGKVVHGSVPAEKIKPFTSALTIWVPGNSLQWRRRR
ncbi:MAG: hypothetical protein MI921_12015 [Cytophagales bacterium]|nr:hypothetical protein [Cytophagales bacterium]